LHAEIDGLILAALANLDSVIQCVGDAAVKKAGSR
jgi:hypothetical protein